MPRQHHEQALKRAQDAIESARNAAAASRYRQRYHFVGPCGWINDPNGLIYFQGKYHFFYQFNPYGAFWDSMHWGHAVSDDLIRWEHLPPALAPSEPYDDHPKGGCFSGSAIEHQGKLYLLYTGCTENGHGPVQTQCLAVSEDGLHFEKVPENPVITAPPGFDHANFRDPKVWRQDGVFYAVCGCSRDNRGQALMFRSDDLYRWHFVGVLAESRGELGSMWECPDLFSLGDRFVLTFSPMHAGDRKAVYLIGDLDCRRGTFHHHSSGELDWGFDFYAAQSFADASGRRVSVAWANEWQFMPWFRNWGPTFRDGWCGFFTIPREMRLTQGPSLSLLPIDELKRFRYGEASREDWIVETQEHLAPADPVAFDLEASLDLTRTDAQQVSFLLRGGEGRMTKVIFDLANAQLMIDRSNVDGWSEGMARCPLPLADHKALPIRILSDTCSLEVFALDGRVCCSANIYPSPSQTENAVAAEGGRALFNRLKTWGISG